MSRIDEIIGQLNALESGDNEAVHGEADALLLDALSHLGHQAVVDAYEELISRCSWWACA